MTQDVIFLLINFIFLYKKLKISIKHILKFFMNNIEINLNLGASCYLLQNSINKSKRFIQNNVWLLLL